MISERELILKSPEYLSGNERLQQAFDQTIQIFHTTYNRDIKIGINGYTASQEGVLILSTALVIHPELLLGSQCSHRTVASALSMQFTEGDGEMERLIRVKLTELNILGTTIQARDGLFLVIWGVNNWEEAREEDRLDCKLTPGLPEGVPGSHLIHLENIKVSPSTVDDACPKRLYGATCNIVHAERSVIEMGLKLSEQINAPTPSKVFLTCTWVPCFDCFSLITGHQEVFGGNIDIFPVYKAEGDEDDEKMTKAIMEERKKQGIEGSFFVPLISVPKKPGYGWYPARKEGVSEIREYLTKINYPGKEARLLMSALRLIN